MTRIGALGSINGMLIIESELATESVPRRKHQRTRAMSASYHHRVQKKWNRRYGFKEVPGAYVTPHGIVAHPEVAAALRERGGRV